MYDFVGGFFLKYVVYILLILLKFFKFFMNIVVLNILFIFVLVCFNIVFILFKEVFVVFFGLDINLLVFIFIGSWFDVEIMFLIWIVWEYGLIVFGVFFVVIIIFDMILFFIIKLYL